MSRSSYIQWKFSIICSTAMHIRARARTRTKYVKISDFWSSLSLVIVSLTQLIRLGTLVCYLCSEDIICAWPPTDICGGIRESGPSWPWVQKKMSSMASMHIALYPNRVGTVLIFLILVMLIHYLPQETLAINSTKKWYISFSKPCSTLARSSLSILACEMPCN